MRLRRKRGVGGVAAPQYRGCALQGKPSKPHARVLAAAGRAAGGKSRLHVLRKARRVPSTSLRHRCPKRRNASAQCGQPRIGFSSSFEVRSKPQGGQHYWEQGVPAGLMKCCCLLPSCGGKGSCASTGTWQGLGACWRGSRAVPAVLGDATSPVARRAGAAGRTVRGRDEPQTHMLT